MKKRYFLHHETQIFIFLIVCEQNRNISQSAAHRNTAVLVVRNICTKGQQL